MTGRLEKETAFYAKLDKKLMEVPPVIGEFCTWMRARRMSYGTVGDYTNKVLHFMNFITNGNPTPDFYKNVKDNDIERYMIFVQTRQTKNGVRRTGDDILQGRWSALNTFFSWLLKRGCIQSNPVEQIDRPKNETEHKVIYLDKTEIDKLIKAAGINSNPILALRTLFRQFKPCA